MHPIYLLGLGIPCSETPRFPSHAQGILEKADVLIGGHAQLGLLAAHPAEKLQIGADTENLYRRMAELRAQGKLLVALCSGDPLYYGLGARLAERFGPDALRVVPNLSSLQAATAFLGLPWENMRSVSLHGRNSMLPLAHALVEAGEAGPVCLLCDAATSPAAIASWMLERGCSAYDMHLLDDLRLAPDGTIITATPGAHRRRTLTEAAALAEENAAPGQRIILLLPSPSPADSEEPPPAFRPFGVDASLLDKDRGVFTKLPARAAGLAALGIEARDTVWDIGAGSGAVSIDAARLASRGQVFAFEANENRITHLFANRQRCRVPNMEVLPGCFPLSTHLLEQADGLPPPRPHKIFVGGGLGGDAHNARQLLHAAWQALLPGGRLLAHCILLSSLEAARKELGELGGAVELQSIQAAQAVPAGTDVRFEAMNPVFLVLALKPLA